MNNLPPILYMAPIRGITQYPYRNLYARFFGGFDVAVAPFISTTQSETCRKAHIRDVLPENNNGFPVVPQLMSNCGEDFVRMSHKLFQHGYDTINWNLGCPFPMVAKKKRGSGLLPHPRRIESFLSEVVPRIPGKLSIKCRLGRKNREEILNLIPVFNRFPLKEVIIHPRIGTQMYEGTVDLGWFERCVEGLRHSVVYNGDIQTVEMFRYLQDRFPTVDRWMIGRGALIDPFLPLSIKQETAGIDADRLVRIKDFHDTLFFWYRDWMSGPAHLIDKMKGFWFYFSQSFENSEKIFRKIKKIKKVDVYERTVWDFFQTKAVLKI